MDRKLISDYPDVMKACNEGQKLKALKLLKSQTDWSLDECKNFIDSLIEGRNPSQKLNISINKEPITSSINAIIIDPKSSEIEKEIEQIHINIEKLNEENKNKQNEIDNLKNILVEKKQYIEELIHKTYSKTEISKNIAQLYENLNSQYYNQYNSNLVDDEAKLISDIHKNITESSVESILIELNFKHNNIKIKFKGWFYTLTITSLAVFLFSISYEYFRPYDPWLEYKTGNGKSYNFIGWIINAFGGFFVISGLGKLLTLSNVAKNEVIEIINSNKDPKFKELLNYLNSIHKLPAEIKNLI